MTSKEKIEKSVGN